MRTISRVNNDEHGMVLFTSLLILSLLMALGVGSVVFVQNEHRITGNLRLGTAAFYFAEAGIEWGKEQIGLTTTNPPGPADAIREFSAGSFSTSLVSSRQVSALSGQVILRSTGTAGASSHTVQAQVTKIYDLADAALVLRGNSRGVNFTGDSFYLSGFDYDPTTGAAVAGAKARLGITTGNAALLSQIGNNLAPLQRNLIVGSDENGAAISVSTRMEVDTLAAFANDLCSAPNAQVSSIASNGSLSIANQTWGSHANPQLRCIHGLPQSGYTVTVGNNFSGAGILVVKDAQFVSSGALHWEGLIIVSGNGVGFRISGQESKEITGAVIVNETGTAVGPGDPLLDIQGTVRILYSRFTLGAAASLIPAASLTSIYSWLPFYLNQDYWRSVTP